MDDLRNSLNIELPRAKGAYLVDAPETIWEQPALWVLDDKADGERQSLELRADRSIVVGRNRKDKLKGVAAAGPFMVTDHPVFSRLSDAGFAGTILDGELTEFYNQDGTESETTKKLRRAGRFIGYQTWGCLFFKGEDVRHYSEFDRFAMALEVVARYGMANFRMIPRVPATKANLLEIFKAGEEGAIAKHVLGKIPKDQRTMPTWWKLKATKTVDAFVVGVTEGRSGGSGVRGEKAVPNGTAASFTMAMLDAEDFGATRVVCKLKDLPEAVRLTGFHAFKEYEGRVIEMIVSNWNGKEFGWPRFKRWRPDKSRQDCWFDEQVGREPTLE